MSRSRRACGLVVALCLTTGGCLMYDGLKPVNPPPPNPWLDMDSHVPSLTPTLEWEAFPREQDVRRIAAGDRARISDVRYELRVRVDEYEPPAAADAPTWIRPYAIQCETRENRFSIQTPLKPDTRYWWTVRVRFRVDGRLRVSQWAKDDVGEYRFVTRAQ